MYPTKTVVYPESQDIANLQPITIHPLKAPVLPPL